MTDTTTTPSAAALARLSLFAIPLGIVSALAATLFLTLVEYGTELLWHELPHLLGWETLPWAWAALPLALGVGLVVWGLSLPGATGGGPLSGFHFSTPLRDVASILIAAFGSLIAGAALGPEAPLIVVGTTIGLMFTRRAADPARQAAMFIGGIAAVGAVFGSPMITAFMVLEFMALGVAPVALLMPALVALASSYLVQIGVWSLPGVGVHSLAVPGIPSYAGIGVGDFAVAGLTAVVTVVIAVIVRESGLRFERLAAQRRRGAAVIAGAGIWLVASIGIGLLGLDPTVVLFSGNSGMPAVIAETSLAAMLAIIVVKSLITVFSFGGGFRGGAIFPATFLGVAVGMGAHLLLPETGLAAAAATGIAASAAVFTRLPATSALLAVLLIAGTGPAIAPFAIFGAVIGTFGRIVGDRVIASSATSAS